MTTTLETGEPKHKEQHASHSAVTELAIEGMTCGNCARHVAQAIQTVPGVRLANVSLDNRQATVQWEPSATANVSATIQAVKDAGYSARVLESHAHEHSESKVAGWHWNLWVAVIGTLPLMIGEWVFGLGMTPWFRWLSFALAGMVQFFAGAQFYRGAWRQLKRGSSNMDTLVALGSSTAFGYSAWALLTGRPGHLYFMEAAAIIALISTGHWLEARVSRRASSALRRLLELAPRTARVRTGSGVEVETSVADLKTGDFIVLRPGDHIPTDGAVAEGDSAVDESMLTGESTPVDKTVQSELYAGTINLNGRLVMRVTATGEQTALAHIVAAVQRAQSSRANIQRLGDRVSSVFVPAVVLVALAAGLWWGLAPESAHAAHHWLGQFLWPAHPPSESLAAGFIIAASVLIIACPCAMGLATPAAIMAGANAAAQRGILIRDGVALEKAGEATSVVFDKTGTLTIGKPAIASIWKSKNEMGNVEAIAATLARNSTHPISRIIAGISNETVEVKDWKEVRGAGVEAWTKTPTPVQIRLGSLHWLRESRVDFNAREKFVSEWSEQGATIVGLAFDRSLIALFALRDSVKGGAASVISNLHRQGLKTYLLTGDNSSTARSIANEVGVPAEHVFAEIRPEKKAEFVRLLQERGERVAFVGDGINDAPALEQADLGIAVGRASDIAREAADIILLKSEINAVPESLGLARATLRTIKQNLFWAFVYNAIGVPLAALGFMSPVLCAAAMGLSDLVVIGNALRLRAWRNRY